MAESNGEKGEGTTTRHIPVLLSEVLDSLVIEPSDVVVDATLGGGGHAREILSRLGSDGTFIGMDADQHALERAKGPLEESQCTTHFIAENFRNVREVLERLGITQVDKALFDLGLSSDQFDSTSEADGRGFSFNRDEPLLMTLAVPGTDTALVTARDVVNEWSEESLADVIYGFGDERHARKIARAIVTRRESKPIETSLELAEIVAQAIPRHSRIHPATKTFQAIRMAVNDELGALSEGLLGIIDRLAPGGRIAVITFHSHEDRVVKRLFREWKLRGLGESLTKSPIQSSREEVLQNPRARSAKLRTFVRIDQSGVQ
jgi:16S rRNA (cytosine1402-N4)-methyltransferase